MLCITVPEQELFNEATQEFMRTKEQKLQLEHSLISLSKWEAKWNKPFLSKEDKTSEETIDYIRCMTINRVDPDVYFWLTEENVTQINDYISAPMTATTVTHVKDKTPRNGETVTSELIYYWMIAFNIPFECQKWHINRLLKLIEVCEVKNRPPKKMNKRDIMTRNAALNAERRRRLHTKG